MKSKSTLGILSVGLMASALLLSNQSHAIEQAKPIDADHVLRLTVPANQFESAKALFVQEFTKQGQDLKDQKTFSLKAGDQLKLKVLADPDPDDEQVVIESTNFFLTAQKIEGVYVIKLVDPDQDSVTHLLSPDGQNDVFAGNPTSSIVELSAPEATLEVVSVSTDLDKIKDNQEIEKVVIDENYKGFESTGEQITIQVFSAPVKDEGTDPEDDKEEDNQDSGGCSLVTTAATASSSFAGLGLVGLTGLVTAFRFRRKK